MAKEPTIPPALAYDLAHFEFVCGADEVGLGCWAGPLVVCATVVSRGWSLPGVTDSKKMTPAARERLYPKLISSVIYVLVEVSSEEIDRIGVGKAWEQAHGKAIQDALNAHRAKGHTAMPLVIVDGSRGLPGAVALPKADLLIPAVSAASIIAKVYRDNLMKRLDSVYEGYGFRSHVGYGTRQHQEALERLGACAIHRMSYSPMSRMKKG